MPNDVIVDRIAPLTPPVADTFGISTAYQPQEFPKHLYRSHTDFVVVSSKEDEANYLEKGYKLSYADFEAPAPVATSEIDLLKQQVADMNAALAGMTKKK